MGQLYRPLKKLNQASSILPLLSQSTRTKGRAKGGRHASCRTGLRGPHLLLPLVPKIEGDPARCVVCLKIMDSLDTAKVGSFKLIHRPEDA